MGLLAHNSVFISDLMKVLGIDPAMTKGFTLRSYVGDITRLEVEQYVSSNDKENTIIKRWKLTKEELEVE